MNKVFVRMDDAGRVTEINSDMFLSDTSAWTEIDEGFGDRYMHAQGNYLKGGLFTDQGVHRFKLVEGSVVERSPEEIQEDINALPPPPPSQEELVFKQEQRFEALKPIIGNLLTGQEADVVIRLREFMPEWSPGVWKTDQSCIDDGYPFRTIHPGHDSTGNPNWRPRDNRALFAPWHGKSEETALPWFPPVEAESAYKAGEYMIWTDGSICRSKRTTDHSPEVYPADWEVKGEDGVYRDFGSLPVDPEDPEEKNSNGTSKWSEWVDWAGDNSKLYGENDCVTYQGARKISNHNNNGAPPSDTSWWRDE